jgi:NAD(P)-dependent dehydrogenase (short-subunit alcohol dehydrogenase family)
MNTSTRFAGKTALITGGGTGMGRTAAIRIAREGANVVIAGRRQAELENVAREIRAFGGSVLAAPTDVSIPAQVEALIDATLTQFGRLDVAWNNAGIEGTFAPIHELTCQDFDTLMATNLRGTFLSVKYEVAAMRSADRLRQS